MVHFGYIEKFIEALARVLTREICLRPGEPYRWFQNLEGMGLQSSFRSRFNDMRPADQGAHEAYLEQKLATVSPRSALDDGTISTSHDPKAISKRTKKKSTEKMTCCCHQSMAF